MEFLDRCIVACAHGIARVGMFLARMWVYCVFLFVVALIFSGLWALVSWLLTSGWCDMSKAKRKMASDAARASVALEGFFVPMDTLAEAEKYINGEINIQELISHLYRQAEKK